MSRHHPPRAVRRGRVRSRRESRRGQGREGKVKASGEWAEVPKNARRVHAKNELDRRPRTDNASPTRLGVPVAPHLWHGPGEGRSPPGRLREGVDAPVRAP